MIFHQSFFIYVVWVRQTQNVSMEYTICEVTRKRFLKEDLVLV